MTTDQETQAPCRVFIVSRDDTPLELHVHRASGDGPHPAVVLSESAATLATHYADEGFTAIVFSARAGERSAAGPDEYRTVLDWAAGHSDIDGARIFAWCRCLSDLQALNVARIHRRLGGAIVHAGSDSQPTQRGWSRRHTVRARTSAITYPLLVVTDGKENDERLMRQLARRAERIEMFATTSLSRTSGVEADFLRYHAGLPTPDHRER